MANIDWQNDSDKEIENKMKDTVFNLDMLMNAAYYGRVEIIRFMKKENYIDRETINQVDTSSSYCPLYNAILSGSVEAVELLIKLGAEVDKVGKHKLVTALHLAASLGHTEIIKILATSGANVNSVVNIGITPLHLAAYEGHVEAVKLLIERGANVDAQDENGETAMHLAKRAGFPEIVKVLVATKKKRKTKDPSVRKGTLNNKKSSKMPLFFFSLEKKTRDI